MNATLSKGLGWQRDLPDVHDDTVERAEVKALLQNLPASHDVPCTVDYRDYCLGVDDQEYCNSSVAHACAGLLQYYERRASGKSTQPSRMFMYRTARRLSQHFDDCGTSLRTMWKAVVRFGTATENVWPFDPTKINVEPDAFTYAFDRSYATLRYVRLDTHADSGEQTLERVKASLAAGFACVFGFPVFGSIGCNPDISLPSIHDPFIGGQAVMLVGYDDQRRYRSSKGSLLIRNSWGSDWGEDGYGWLPYDYVREKLAVDFWIIAHDRWLESGEFESPIA